MLINFSLRNYRSIKNTQSISMVASNAKEHRDTHVIEAEGNDLLASAVVYGANASGKSNLIKGLGSMRRVVIESSRSNISDEFSYHPFKLDPSYTNAPIEFEVTFLEDDVRYQYGFAISKTRVVEEWLFAFPKARAQKWLDRKFDFETGKYIWNLGDKLQGEKVSWQKSTRDNALFLSTAVSFNSEQLRPIYNWFSSTLKVLVERPDWGLSLTAGKIENDPELVLNFLKAADLNIENVVVDENKFDPAILPNDMPDFLRENLAAQFKDKTILDFSTQKSDSEGNLIDFNLESDESTGTKKLFAMAGPWIYALQGGHVLVIDELNTNLHPKLVAFLIGLFNDPTINTAKGQLIITSHDTSIMSQDTLRRDQIWFCEKGDDGATNVFPLSDFSPRIKHEDIEKYYLNGRYGAIPFLDKDLWGHNHGQG